MNIFKKVNNKANNTDRTKLLPPTGPTLTPSPSILTPTSPQQLNRYHPSPNYHPGRPFWIQVLWYYFGSPLVASHLLPFSGLKLWILRQFGATLGQGVRLKPGIQIKFPWRLTIGDHSWIGENTWIDNLAPIKIGDHVCVSQGVYFCTGNHNWSEPTFDLCLGSIQIESNSWIGANAVIGPGVIVGAGAVLTLGSVATQSLEPMMIHTGHPAQAVKQRLSNT